MWVSQCEPVLRQRQWSSPGSDLRPRSSCCSLLSACLPLAHTTGTITGALGQGAPSSGLVTWGLCCQGGYEDSEAKHTPRSTPRPMREAPIYNTEGVGLTL